jgi:hypothetical protein
VDGAYLDNLKINNFLETGYHRFEKYEKNSEKRTGVFYIGGDG